MPGTCFVAGTPVILEVVDDAPMVVEAPAEPQRLGVAVGFVGGALVGLAVRPRADRKSRRKGLARGSRREVGAAGPRSLDVTPSGDAAAWSGMELGDSLLGVDDAASVRTRTRLRQGKNSTLKWVTHAACFLLAIALGGWVVTSVPAPWSWGASATQTVAADASANARFHTAGIEEVRVGQRLRTAGVSDCQNCETEVDPATWRLVRMRIDEHRLPDGTPDPVDIESLQPLAWIAEHDARPGRHVPVPLDLADMGLPEDLACRVVAVEPCPAIESGPGRVVLNTVTHLNNYLFNLVVEDASGRSETIRTTGFHKFRSRTRSEWVSADTLTAGESLEGMSSPLTVASLERVPGTFRVYNLTVEAEHVFRISDLGVLVHNNRCGRVGPRRPRTDVTEGTYEDVIDDERGIVHVFPGQPVGRTGQNLDEALDLAADEALEAMRRRRATGADPLGTD